MSSKGYVWVISGQVAGAVGLLVGMRLITEIVPPEIFGTVNLLVGISALATTIFCGPSLHAASRFYPESARRGEIGELRRTISRQLARTTVVLSALLVGGGAVWGLRGELPWGVFAVTAGLMAVEVFRTFEINFLLAARRQKECAIWGAAEAWARPLIALLLFVAVGCTAECMIGGYFLATCAGYCLCLLIVRRDGVSGDLATTKGNETLREAIRRYTRPLMPVAVVSWVNALSDRYVIGGLGGVQLVGIYAAVYGLTSRPFLMVHGTLVSIFRPAYFQAVSGGEDWDSQRILLVWFGATIGVCAAGVGLAWALQGPLVRLLLGEAYWEGAGLVPVLAVAFTMQVASQVLNTVSLAYKESRNVLLSEASGAVLWLILGIPLVWRLGLWGAATATALAYFVQMLTAGWGASGAKARHMATG